MARIRTIKPDFWQHPKVTRVSRDARLFFLGLLNEADDEGRLRYSGKRLAGVIFPADDDVTGADIDAWTGELERVGLVRRYSVEDAPLLLVCGFTEHQTINRPSISKLPSPLTASSRAPHAPLTEPSLPEEEQGTGNREEEQGEPPVELALVSPPATTKIPPVEIVFAAWRESTGHHRSVLDAKRRRIIERGLKTHPVADLVDAVRGWRHSPHHRGENDRHTVYDDLELLLRDAAHIERFRDLARGGRQPRTPVLPAGSDLTARNLARITGGNV